jgi:hypothetical protein
MRTKFLSEELKEIDYREHSEIDGRIILKLLVNMIWGCALDSVG